MLFLYHPRNTFANFLSNVLNSSAPSWRAQRKRLFQKLAFWQAHKSHFQNSRERPRRLGTAFTVKTRKHPVHFKHYHERGAQLADATCPILKKLSRRRVLIAHVVEQETEEVIGVNKYHIRQR